MYNFDSKMEIGLPLPDFTATDVKNETMFFSSSLKYARDNGGPITDAFVNQALRAGWELDDIFDSRVHMLMKGWFPCIPGWHHDDVARGGDGQPDYDSLKYKSRHVMGLINGGVAPTEFSVGNISLPKVDKSQGPVYKVWHDMVEQKTVEGSMIRVAAPSNKLVSFDWQAFHQGVRAVDNGWRWFGRISAGTDRRIRNEIRRQVQVYLEFPMEGW
jgi:hypothetical protein